MSLPGETSARKALEISPSAPALLQHHSTGPACAYTCTHTGTYTMCLSLHACMVGQYGGQARLVTYEGLFLLMKCSFFYAYSTDGHVTDNLSLTTNQHGWICGNLVSYKALACSIIVLSETVMAHPSHAHQTPSHLFHPLALPGATPNTLCHGILTLLFHYRESGLPSATGPPPVPSDRCIN